MSLILAILFAENILQAWEPINSYKMPFIVPFAFPTCGAALIAPLRYNLSKCKLHAARKGQMHT
jgi:hypothetical protein